MSLASATAPSRARGRDDGPKPLPPSAAGCGRAVCLSPRAVETLAAVCS